MRQDLTGMPIYQPPSSNLLNLANNENFYAGWQKILKDDFESILASTSLFCYGTSTHDKLITNYSSYMKVKPEQVLVAPGSDGLIPLLINSLTNKKILTFDTDFFRYNQAAQILQRYNTKVTLNEECYDEIVEKVKEEDIEMVLFSNPNNPLGIIHSDDNILKILDKTNCFVVVDEAYGEYNGSSMAKYLNKYPKLIVLRTMSKAWGLAGLRVGYALSSQENIKFLKAVQGPFTLSDLNANIAACVLEKQSILYELIEELKTTKKDFNKYLHSLNLEKVYESHSNFIYVKDPRAALIHQTLLDDNIAIARFKEDGLRITIGTSEQMERIKNCIEKAGIIQ